MGRENELAAIRPAMLGQADVCGVLIVGDPGVGKTTLARSAAGALRTPAHWVAGTESAREIPLGMFAHLLNRPTSGDPIAMLAAAFDTIRHENFSVIGVDDVHLVDHLSATLLHQLAVEGSVRIVATARSSEPIPETIISMWKDGYLDRLDIAPFSKCETIRLVETALEGRLEQLSADTVWKATGGNALFVRHLIEGALEAGTLRRVNGIWQLRGNTAVGPAFAPLLGSRLNGLPNDEIHALQLLAVSEPLALGLMSELVSPGTVERLEQRNLVQIVDGIGSTDIHFTHALIGDVIRQSLGHAAPRRLSSQLLAAMVDHPLNTTAERLRRAELALQADHMVDVNFLERAAEDAIALTNITLAERLARAAVRQGGGLVASEILARSLLWQGKSAESAAILSSFDPDTLTESELVRWGIARVANLQWSIGNNEAAGEILAMLRERVSHPKVRLVLDGLGSALLVLDNRLEDSAALASRVLAEPTAPAMAVGWAVFGGISAAALMGRTDDAARLADRGRQIDDDIGGLLRFLLALGEVRALTLSGEFDAAEALSGDIVRITCPDQYRARAMANALAGTVEFGRGRLAAAAERLEETLAALNDDVAACWNVPVRLLLAQCYCGLGKSSQAAPLVAELRDLVSCGQTPFEPAVRIAEAWLAAAEGHITRAIQVAVDAADLAVRSGQRATELLALHAAARFGDRTCLQRLIDVAGDIGGPLAGADLVHATGLMNRNGAEVFSAAAEFERIGAMLSAADAAAQAATLFEAAAKRRDALAATAVADRLAKACGGLRTPALRATSQPLPLSRREREIAHLVAGGLTNRGIADRLVVSTRTVEGHLYRIFQKLDITDRDELTALIRRVG